MQGTGTVTCSTEMSFSKKAIEEWDTKEWADRAFELHKVLTITTVQSYELSDEALQEYLASFRYEDTNGNKFSITEVAKMTSSEVILRGILK